MRPTAASPASAAEEDASGVPKKAPLILFWAVATAFWSIFTPPEKTYATRVLLFQPAWALRIFYRDPSWRQDLVLFLALHTIYSYWTGAWQLPNLAQLDPRNEALRLYAQVFSLLGICGAFAGGIVFRGHHLGSSEHEEPVHERIDEQVLPPLLLPSRTTHSRLFPKKHAFSYSYLLVCIPVGIQGRISKLLSVDTERHGWFEVDAEDYLVRGTGGLTLAQKLKQYLHAQGVTDRDYAFSYLVTAPRFLGYSFNPVSFWYLYDSDTKLKYMILEVNNTFDERRIYLLKPGSAADGDVDDDLVPQNHINGSAKTSKQLVFTETWQKDFHVSPFNSRKGSYSLRATDPLASYEETGIVKIDNTIVLRSSKDHPKIVARVFSEGFPKDPAQVSGVEAASFILSWCWVGFATFPRIVSQAAKLSLQRRLHVWYRPEVTSTSIGRPYTEDEKSLETLFRAFLTNAVQEGSKPLRLVYEPAHNEGADGEVVLYSPGFTYEEDHKRTLTLKVLSPAFYSRFVHHGHTKVAFQRECLAAEERNRTATLEREGLLDVLVDSIQEQSRSHQSRSHMTSIGRIEQVRWVAMRRLRCPPAAVAYPGSNWKDGHGAKDLKLSALSDFDTFILTTGTNAALYRRITTKLFLAERLAFGLPAILSAIDFLFKAALLLASMIYSDASPHMDVLRPRKLGTDDLSTVTTTLLLANSVHIWSLLKG